MEIITKLDNEEEEEVEEEAKMEDLEEEKEEEVGVEDLEEEKEEEEEVEKNVDTTALRDIHILEYPQRVCQRYPSLAQ